MSRTVGGGNELQQLFEQYAERTNFNPLQGFAIESLVSLVYAGCTEVAE
jgi:hypothetical protein